jgi:hypothetical protein
MESQAPATSLPKRLAWFVGLWAMSVAALGAVALLLRWALHP